MEGFEGKNNMLDAKVHNSSQWSDMKWHIMSGERGE